MSGATTELPAALAITSWRRDVHDLYGAGRYLLDTVKGADLGRDGDRLVIDLNFGYNPSCAYDPAWACPLAPAGNRLEAAAPVGELIPAG